MKHIPAIILFCLSLSTTLKAQQVQPDTLTWGTQKNMPHFYEELKARLTWPMAWGNSKQTNFKKWRKQARHTLMDCAETILPAPESYSMSVSAREQREGYEARKIWFNVSEWCRIPAYLLVPEGEGPFPAIVMLHDHGAHFSIGKEKMVRPFNVSPEVMEDADHWAAGCYDNQYVGDYFAAHGYVVLAIDALFWGERGRKEGPDYDGQQALAGNFLQMGTSWGSVINMDDVRSAEFLASLPFVDAGKIGSLGFSMGAYRSWMMAAMSDVVAASASICWMNTTAYLMTLTNNQNKGGSAYSMLLPGLRRYMDYPHVAAIACPKPALFFNGTRDKLFPVEGVEDAYRIMRQTWESQKAGERLVTKIWEEKHFFNKAMQHETLQFFDKWLKR
ncbi:MAG: dienelactone hydrolase family protein [Bacteroides sp.]|nr:dienelactone hydrolase family protein [Bacteroides sp.]